MKRQFSAGFVIFYEKDGEIQYLLLHYPGGHWGFPKGKIEQGEDKVQTALRELKEETGIETADILQDFEAKIEYFFRVKKELYFKEVIFLLAQVTTQKIALSHEHQAYEWLDYEKAYERLTYQNSKDVLKYAHKFLKKELI